MLQMQDSAVCWYGLWLLLEVSSRLQQGAW